MINELGRLSQGNDSGVKANDRVKFMHHREVTTDRKVTYEKTVCNYQPLKSDP